VPIAKSGGVLGFQEDAIGIRLRGVIAVDNVSDDLEKRHDRNERTIAIRMDEVLAGFRTSGDPDAEEQSEEQKRLLSPLIRVLLRRPMDREKTRVSGPQLPLFTIAGGPHYPCQEYLGVHGSGSPCRA
jgi:hypothetical protein